MNLVGDINIWLSLILAVLYFLRYRSHDWDYKYFTLYLISYAGIQWALWLVIYLTEGGENLFLFLPYLLLQFIFLTLFYMKLLNNKKILYTLIPVLLFLLIQYSLSPNLVFGYNPLGIFITQSIIIVYSLGYMYKSLTKPEPFSIINLGIFFYMVSATLVFVTGNWVKGNEFQYKLSVLFYHIRDIVYLLLQLLILIEWWRNFYRVKTR